MGLVLHTPIVQATRRISYQVPSLAKTRSGLPAFKNLGRGVF